MREILDEDDPYGPPAPAGGPEYKQGVDADGDGRDDLFAPPYGGELVHALMGSADAPDVRIDDPGFLDRLSDTIFGGFPDARAGVRARVEGIAVFAPPYERTRAGWERRGTGTIRVTAAIRATGRLLATRTATLVVQEIRYGSDAPAVLHSCGDLLLSGTLPAHWGTVSVSGSVLAFPELRLAESLPRAVPAAAESDPLWTEDPAWIAEFVEKVDPFEPVPDPWLRLVAGGTIDVAPSAAEQPYAGPPPPLPGRPGPWPCCDASNVIQRSATAGCPLRDYEWWKRVVMSGESGLHYFRYDSAGAFREDGTGPPLDFREVFERAGGEEGVWFFDTRDGLAPRDDDADGGFDNLTPEILVTGSWGARGFVFLNAERLTAAGLAETLAETLHAPPEPSVEGGAWIDLAYPPMPFGGFAVPGDGVRGAGAEGMAWQVAFRGVLYTTGAFEAGPGGTYYGSVIAVGGITLDGATMPPPAFFRDSGLSDAWPPPGWRLPRVAVTGAFVEP
jgi:hypothetical protein